jgi:hypothetical protein
MHLLYEFMFEAGQLFDAFALRVKLVQQGALFARNPVHPPETDNPAKGSNQSQPESHVNFIHH